MALANAKNRTHHRINTERDVIAQTNANKAIECRKAGMTLEQMSKVLKLSREGCRKALMRGMEELQAHQAEEAPGVRAMEMARIDAMLLGVWDRARKGDQGAIDRVIKLMQQRARYMPGLEVPVRTELTGADGGPVAMVAVEAASLMQRYAEMDKAAALVVPVPSSAPAATVDVE